MENRESFNEKHIAYMKEVLNWNEKINLTAISEEDEFLKKHIEDSLSVCGREEIENAKNILDLGTGGGFPGVPLAIHYPEKSFTLLDSVEKKLNTVAAICKKLDISNVSVLHSRAEDAAHSDEYREKFDVCVSRAVARLSVLSEYCLPFVKKGGYFVAYKGAEIKEELEEAKKAIKILGGNIVDIYNYGCDEYSHCLIFVKKNSETPLKYPRKAGMPTKAPLR